MSCLVEACWKLKSCVQSYLATPQLTAAAAGRPAKKTARPGSLTKPRITCRETPSRRAFSFAPLQSCIIRFFWFEAAAGCIMRKIPRFISVQRVYSGSVCMCCLSRLYDLRPAEGEKATRAHRTRFPLVSVSPRRLGCSMPPKVVLGEPTRGGVMIICKHSAPTSVHLSHFVFLPPVVATRTYSTMRRCFET